MGSSVGGTYNAPTPAAIALTDANTGSNSALIVLTTNAQSLWSFGPGQVYDSITVSNPDPTLGLLVTLTFTGSTVASGDTEFLVPPESASIWTNELPVIASVAFGYVNLALATAGSVTDGSALPAAAPAARRNVIANVGRK